MAGGKHKRLLIRDLTEYRNPLPGSVTFTCNKCADDLHPLTKRPYELISSDNHGYKKKTVALLRKAGVSQSKQFACLAARVFNAPDKHGKAILQAYCVPRDRYIAEGSSDELIFVVDFERIRSDLLLFAGDAQNLVDEWDSNKETLQVKTTLLPLRQLAAELESRVPKRGPQTTRPDRLRGPYFEARLTRPLRPTDISAIYLDKANRRAVKIANQIGKVRSALLRHAGCEKNSCSQAGPTAAIFIWLDKKGKPENN